MPFNLTNLTTPGVAPTIVNYFTYANEVTFGWFGVVVPLVLFFVPFFGLVNKWGAPRAFTVAAFITNTISLGLMVVGIVDEIVFFMSLVAFAIGAAVWLGRGS